MKPDRKSKTFLAITRSKGKMYEYFVPESDHIATKIDPLKLLTLTLGILGDTSTGHIDETYRENSQFSANFFDAFVQSRLNSELDPYLILFGSAAYYLSDLPGSSKVLASSIVSSGLALEGNGLEKLLAWLLQANYSNEIILSKDLYFSLLINQISQLMRTFINTGEGSNELLASCQVLRQKIYVTGNSRELLFSDLICAITKKRVENSVWNLMPSFSGIAKENWRPIFEKSTSIKELWPAQHLLGKSGVFKGKSAVIQMPTSSGKTKAIELIIRSSFLANRSNLVVIVAPFRALCHEIKNSMSKAFEEEEILIDEMTDVLQIDYVFDELSINSKQILVVTPEKLIYVLRHTPDLASTIGLIIFDEGHQFDNGARGITYELLLTSLKSKLSDHTQKIIISAVISNADAVGKWFNGEQSITVTGTNLIPTSKSIGFVSWLGKVGRVEYVSNENIDEEEYFVPRVIEPLILNKKPRERRERIFPDKLNNQEIALYLGLKLVKNGSVAIFCGKKTTALNICSTVVDIFERGLSINTPSTISDCNELTKLYNLHIKNLGRDAVSAKGAALGIFTHHNNIPHGIRLAVEYAMQKNLIHFVICTSTLAQGVNLPLRYLIVNSLYQGLEEIKVRDFHNLIGRAGRSGMYTEGSILFTDPVIFDRRIVKKERWRWKLVKKLFNVENSEPCVSNLLSIFNPIVNDNNDLFIKMEALDFAKTYVENFENGISNLSKAIVEKFSDSGFSLNGVTRQIEKKMSLVSAIESFLMSNWSASEEMPLGEKAKELAQDTLAYSLANDVERKQIVELFVLLSNNISTRIINPSRGNLYSKTLFGIKDSQIIDQWVHDNIDNLLLSDSTNLLNLIWPLLTRYVRNRTFNKCNNYAILKKLVQGWISGKPFYELVKILSDGNAKIITGRSLRQYSIESVVDMCEGGISYEGSLLLSAIIEFIDQFDIENKQQILTMIKNFQKKLKYGLPTQEAIILYEIGFSDRVISQEISSLLGAFNADFEAKYLISTNFEKVNRIINQYPLYYEEILKRYL